MKTSSSIVFLGLLIIISAPFVAIAAFDVNLQFGSKGPAVVELQKALIEKGHLSGTPTGNFFSLTKQAVIAFQKAAGLPQSGFVGPLTRAKLAGQTGSQATVPQPPSTQTPNSQTLSQALSAVPFFMIKNTFAFSSTTAFQTPSSKRPSTRRVVSGADLEERPINPKTVVLVRCKFTGAYINSTTEPPEPLVTTGSGTLVSSDGHILTAAHIIRDAERNVVFKEYGYNIRWTREACDVAFTDGTLTPIDASYRTQGSATAFVPATIVFEPTDVQYNPFKFEDPDRPGKIVYLEGGSDLDFALLKVATTGVAYAPMAGKLVIPKIGDHMIGLGYPGLVISAPLALERIDTVFNGFSWHESSTCTLKAVPEDCGLNYQAKRYKENFKTLYGKSTNLGKHTSYFRGGFSGGPLFYKGHVIGILVTSMENEYSNMYDLTAGQWNWVDARATSELAPLIQAAGIALPTAP